MKDIMKTFALIFIGLLALSNTIYARGKRSNGYTDNYYEDDGYYDDDSIYKDDSVFELNYTFEEDEFNGPGMSILNNTWNGSLTNRIYTYGDLNDILGNEIVNSLAFSCNGPGTENSTLPGVIYNAFGPGFTVNGFTTTDTQYIDMGPTYFENTVSPSDIIKFMNMTPKDLAEKIEPVKKNSKNK